MDSRTTSLLQDIRKSFTQKGFERLQHAVAQAEQVLVIERNNAQIYTRLRFITKLDYPSFTDEQFANEFLIRGIISEESELHDRPLDLEGVRIDVTHALPMLPNEYLVYRFRFGRGVELGPHANDHRLNPINNEDYYSWT